MTLPHLSEALRTLPGYEPSEGVYSFRPPRPLSANESAYDPLPGITEAVTRAFQTANRYPDPGCRTLTRALAAAHDIPEEQFVVGAGTVALLQLLFQSISEPGAEAVYAWPSFELYPILAQLAGVTSIRVLLVDEAHDLSRMADRVTSRTRLVVICNPNNPTGTVASGDELGRFLSRIPPTCLIVFDEAYYEFVREHDTRSGLGFCPTHPNVVVLRTFSKAYGLAGLRAGYLVAAPEVAAELRKGVLPYSVSSIAQAAAVAAMELQEQISERVGATVCERARVRDALRRTGWELPESQANFLWLPLRGQAPSFAHWCITQGIAVRMFPGRGVRVTVGSAADNDAFLAAASEWRKRLSPGAEDGQTAIHEQKTYGS
ncbi:histidinol-phosphate transaminase [Streptomyces sp. NPDC090306]|uniref:histidinol-phosphate transaminase n=1 Tax=Streptomyces sp. NPDC090306 TaxID=3365961 RepID=UPI003812BED2